MSYIKRFIWENKISQKFMFVWAFNSKCIIKYQLFTANINLNKYVEILKNSKSDINILISNGILFLWDND